MTFEQVERKIMRPPAAHNIARLLDPSCEIKTTNNVARFAVSIPSFNYLPAMAMCKDRVSLGLELGTALAAVASSGAPAGREHNAALVRAFWEFDQQRGYSKLRVVDSYDGMYQISREMSVPTVATFTILEKGKQVPVVLCGWKAFSLDLAQIRAWLTMLNSGLFSFADYRHSPWEVLLLPEEECGEGRKRQPLIINRDDYPLFSEADMRDLAAMYARAQKAAMPIAREMWEKREQRRRDKIVEQLDPISGIEDTGMRDLFADDSNDNEI